MIYIYIYVYIYNLQFGFKYSILFPDGIFPLTSVINQVDSCSSIFIASLDISKAFDRANQFKSFNYLLDSGLFLLSLMFCIIVMIK